MIIDLINTISDSRTLSLAWKEFYLLYSSKHAVVNLVLLFSTYEQLLLKEIGNELTIIREVDLHKFSKFSLHMLDGN